jgi:beta-phosphoglucomutase
MGEFKAVFFDMDGVLIDARDWHFDALNEALRIFGIEIDLEQHLSRFDGLSTKRKLHILSEEEGLPWELHSVIEAVKQDRLLRIAAQKCFPNVSHQILLSRLKSHGFQVGLVTNSIRQSTEIMLGYAGLLKFMDVVVTNQDVVDGKPSPEGYKLAMSQLGVASSESLVIEDGEHGVLAAIAAGAQVLRVKGPIDVSIELLLPMIPKLRG